MFWIIARILFLKVQYFKGVEMSDNRYQRIKTCLSVILFIILPVTLLAGASDPPNFIPSLTIQYEDPQTKKQIVHEIESYSDVQKTYQVPGGVELTLIFETHNIGGNPGGDGVSLDVWLDWAKKSLPKDDDSADLVCVPQTPSDCFHFEETIAADADFKGSGGKGVYNMLIWVDRFDTQAEDDEEDNMLGPIKIVATKVYYLQQPTLIKPQPSVLKTPTKVKKNAQ